MDRRRGVKSGPALTADPLFLPRVRVKVPEQQEIYVASAIWGVGTSILGSIALAAVQLWIPFLAMLVAAVFCLRLAIIGWRQMRS